MFQCFFLFVFGDLCLRGWLRGLDVLALDAIYDFQALRLYADLVELAFPPQPKLDGGDHLILRDEDALFLRVIFRETHLLDLYLLLGNFVLAEEDGERNAVVLGRLELLWDLGFDLVHEFGLILSAPHRERWRRDSL